MRIRELVKGDNTITLMIKSVEERITSGAKAYIVVSLTDGKDEISANKWDANTHSAKAEGLEPGAVCEWVLNVGEYNGKASYKVVRHAPSQASQEAFLPHIAERETMYQEMVSAVMQFTNKELLDLTFYLLNKNKDRLVFWSAASNVHHNLIGGLIYHMYRMYKQAENLVYNEAFDKELLIAGVILHDIGKLMELDTDCFGNASYTTKGNLFGHLFLGAMMVKEAGKIMNTSEGILTQIMHIIVSHHGKYEWGAIALPQTTEAYLVHTLDMLDSRMYQYEKVYDTLEPGTCSDRIYSLDNTRIYRF